MNNPYDLHAHSDRSDGTESPSAIVQKAKEKGLSLLAVTDHDTADGVSEAVNEGKRIGLSVIPGIEFNTEHPGELHILGYCVDIQNEALINALSSSKRAREKRNGLIFEKLKSLGLDISGVFKQSSGTTTRLNFAIALRDAGYADSAREAFNAYLSPGAPAYVPTERIAPEDVIEVIHGAGGVAVLAHPCKLKGDPLDLIRKLMGAGIDGLEVYYPGSTEEQTERFLNFALQNGLMVTCGSDYHGANRSSVSLGCSWRDTPELKKTFERLIKMLP
ncbi:MAG: error-prone DNA polymerase [Firmicutes bacterium ADurb.Bin182]|nr:MAG: error-prone DNA polymerase [Firmicutes bacterium ADurb.Bin182]